MKKDIYILGISESHNATAALLKNGEIIGCYNEERLNRKKNYLGYPKLAIHKLLKEFGISGKDLQHVVLNFKRNTILGSGEHQGSSSIIGAIYNFQLHLTYRSDFFNSLFKKFYPLYLKTINRKWYDDHIRFIANDLDIDPAKIISFSHHLTHAASVVYSMGYADKKVLVMTSDGAGDEYCASVSVYNNYSFDEKALTPNEHTLAGMYARVTTYMGMKANEHEYKIMGLAPYTNPLQDGVIETTRILSDVYSVDGLHIHSRVEDRHHLFFLDHSLKRKRFDWIAYSIQKVVEEKLSKWVDNAVKKTRIDEVCCAGGIFMNVKANKVISELNSVKKLTVMPSSSDESTSIGAAFLGYVDYCKKKKLPIEIRPFKNLYFGNTTSNDEVKKYISKNKLEKKYSVAYFDDPEKKVAELLSQGKIVARYSGRMEFGQRALGNRSILANPSKREVIRDLNDRIKSRDFWMPFAGSILEECAAEYILNPKKLQAYYMILSFDTTPKAKETIFAALHPYDHTIRPQIVNKYMNPKYHYLISEFKKLTGIGAVLNTSLNLHGEPIVYTLDDAFHTLADSGLEYLQIENYIFNK